MKKCRLLFLLILLLSLCGCSMIPNILSESRIETLKSWSFQYNNLQFRRPDQNRGGLYVLFAYYLPGKLFNRASHLYTTSRRTISSARALQLFISFAHRRLFVALSCSAMPSALAKASVSSRTHCDASASISASCSFIFQVVSRVV